VETSGRNPLPALCVVGDALLDLDWDGDVRRVSRDAPAMVLDSPTERARPGGAALAAALTVATGGDVTFVTALGRDPEGRRLRALLDAAGVDVVDLVLDGPTPVKLRLRSGSHSLVRVDRACSPVAPAGRWTAAADAAVAGACAVLVSDYGRGLAARPEVAAAASGAAPVVWDPHVGGPRPPRRVTLATPNLEEAHALAGGAGPPPDRLSAVVALAADTAAALGCAVAVTAGARGAVLAGAGALPAVVPATAVTGDVCGAGDQFAASAALALAAGATPLAAVERAVVDAAAFVAGVAPPAARGGTRGRVVALQDAQRIGPTSAAVHRAGGVVVAAGGCFDVLHAGHVQLLDQARRLGDHLVVCLNSDDSVRRLKGPGRPLNSAPDRAAVLRSLAAVDEVVVFDEDTPAAALAAIRPDLFVKGADYLDADLEERAAMAAWGGQVVVLPLVAERSTTRLIATAAGAAG
jgi:rfaE bifunctional protein nucleotidyltransferase chain/domain/rfaE bifunctional protein kinase chain/domain